MTKRTLRMIVLTVFMTLGLPSCKDNNRPLPSQFDSINSEAKTYYEDADLEKHLSFYNLAYENIGDRNLKKMFADYAVSEIETKVSKAPEEHTYVQLRALAMAAQIAPEPENKERLIAKGMGIAIYANGLKISYYKEIAEFYEKCLPLASNPETIKELYRKLIWVYTDISTKSGEERESKVYLGKANDMRARQANAQPTLK